MPAIFRSWRWVVVASALVASTAVAAPARGGKKVAVDKARAALISSDAAKAKQAASELGGSADPAAHAALLDALATGLLPDVAATAVAAVAARPAPADLVTLRVYASHRVPAVRAAAVRALASYQGTGAEILAALHDGETEVRAAGAHAAAATRVPGATEPLLALLDKGDVAAGLALGQLADADLARVVAEHFGTAPDAALTQSLAAMLNRSSFGPEAAREQVVLTLAKLGGADAIAALTAYLDATPASPAKKSRREAEAALKTLLGDDR